RDRAELAALLAERTRRNEARGARYFVDLPQHNRRFGASELIHDEWLYGVYEAHGKAVPRSGWLRLALTQGPVRTVIMPDERVDIPGLREALPELGYVDTSRFGRYRVWERRRSPDDEPGDGTLALRQTSIAPKWASGR